MPCEVTTLAFLISVFIWKLGVVFYWLTGLLKVQSQRKIDDVDEAQRFQGL